MLNKARRFRLYLMFTAIIFFINMLNVDLDNLSWEINRTHYINMIAAVAAFLGIFLLNKNNNETTV
ncbi:hypothetical protein [Tenacibaculum aquimarinum]|uniref:hypothetical protein n=1 Tax=Tenacibaculum aquimarinum TaxID=2910675 RepID=UPI001F0A65C7|nr:hypothetical protein [Tenacibaculum aquimarinum]MCH3885470.1 hypothetical protein [Tenacibaculum aquimarinum]